MRKLKSLYSLTTTMLGRIIIIELPDNSCAWGDFEVIKVADYSPNICDFVAAFGGGSGRGGVLAILNIAVVALTALVIMVAMVSILIGGYIYMTAGGSADRVQMAKKWIVAALLGIIIALAAWIILSAINPYLLGG